MSAVAKARRLDDGALETILRPLIDHHEHQQRTEDETTARTGFEALDKFPRTSKALQAAEVRVAKARADRARAEADLAQARAVVCEVEVEQSRLGMEYGAALKTLRKSAMAPHHAAEGLTRLRDAFEAYRLSEGGAGGAAVLRLAKAIRALCTAQSGDADPPSADIPTWVDQQLADAATTYDTAVRDAVAAAIAHAAQSRVDRLMA